jgi:hypothetical protein
MKIAAEIVSDVSVNGPLGWRTQPGVSMMPDVEETH